MLLSNRAWIAHPLIGALMLSMLMLAYHPAVASTTKLEVVPLRVVEGLPVITVSVGGIKSNLVFDSGLQVGITIPEDIARYAPGVTLLDKWQTMGDAAGHLSKAQELEATDVWIGDLSVGPINGLVHYRWGLSIGSKNGPQVRRNGAIGLGAIAPRSLLIDVASGFIKVFGPGEGSSTLEGAWREIPFLYGAAGITMKLDVDHVPTTFVLDTAATHSVLGESSQLFSQSKLACSADKTSNYCRTATFRSVTTESGQPLPPLSLYVVKMRAVPFDGLIGMDFLSKNKLFVDFQRRILMVQRSSPSVVRRH